MALLGYIYNDPSAFLRLVYRITSSREFNASAVWAVSRAQRVLGESVQCELCFKFFDSKQHLSVHVFKFHGLGRQYRCHINTTQCFACVTEFATRERLLNHLGLPICTPCPLKMKKSFSRLKVKPVSKQLALKRRGLRRHTATTCAVRAEGPMNATSYLVGIDFKLRLRTGKSLACHLDLDFYPS